MPFNELQVFAELYKRDTEKRKRELENLKNGTEMVDLKSMMG